MMLPTETVTGRSVRELVAAARTAERAGELNDAERDYALAVAEEPSSSAAALGLVRLLDKRGDRAGAEEALRSFVAAAGTFASIEAAARQWTSWEDSPRPGVPTFRVALTGSGTLNPLSSHLRVACAQAGLHPAVYVGGFEQWAHIAFTAIRTLHLPSGGDPAAA